jgi:succinate dehydrogenase / fumarate reductase membrane anchor subunit
MSVETREPAEAPMPRPPRASTGRPVGRSRPHSGGEFWWWIFMRASGIALLVLAVGHVLIMHVAGDGVDRVDFNFVAERWRSPFWRSWDWLMLVLALVHGVNGLRMITLDYVRRPATRVAINGFFAIVGAALFALGSIIVFSFDPCVWPGVRC